MRYILPYCLCFQKHITQPKTYLEILFALLQVPFVNHCVFFYVEFCFINFFYIFAKNNALNKQEKIQVLQKEIRDGKLTAKQRRKLTTEIEELYIEIEREQEAMQQTKENARKNYDNFYTT